MSSVDINEFICYYKTKVLVNSYKFNSSDNILNICNKRNLNYLIHNLKYSSSKSNIKNKFKSMHPIDFYHYITTYLPILIEYDIPPYIWFIK